jgi:hypothetical protein
VSAWDQFGNCDLASRVFQRSAFAPPSGAARKEAEAGENLKPAFNVVLKSDTLPKVTKADKFWVVETAGNPSSSTNFYGHWFRRDGTGAIVEKGAWYQQKDTGGDDTAHLKGLSGGIPLPVQEPGTYTVVVLAGTPVDAPLQLHGKRIAHAVYSVSFTYDGKS